MDKAITHKAEIRRDLLGLLIEVTAYYDKDSPSTKPMLEGVLIALSELESIGVSVTLLEKKSLSDEQMKKAVEEIRRIKPQSRGSVVASGGQPLPISGSKRLNLKNTPVLLVERIDGSIASEPVYVFPCKVGELYYSVLDGISYLSRTLPNIAELPGEMEESIIASIKSDPQKLEQGLVFRSSEDSLSTGMTDLVLVDSRSEFLLVEVEREANDAAIGQVLRLAAGFERDHNTTRVRCAIACYRINENVLAAACRAGIEVWKASDDGSLLKLST